MSAQRLPCTRLLVKTRPDSKEEIEAGTGEDWPGDEGMFYLLGSNGLFVGRNHEFFTSCVPARRGPQELAFQERFLEPRFPELSRQVCERIVGFFDRVAEEQGSEAAVVLVWDRAEQRVRLVVPEQTATMTRWGSSLSPVGVHYLPPTDLPPHQVPFGDAHSHVHFAAYSSNVDKEDEEHSAGLHLVVGHIQNEPPQIRAEAVVDGQRFELDAGRVFGAYRSRNRDVPREWIERVRVEVLKPSHAWGGSNGGSGIPVS